MNGIRNIGPEGVGTNSFQEIDKPPKRVEDLHKNNPPRKPEDEYDKITISPEARKLLKEKNPKKDNQN